MYYTHKFIDPQAKKDTVISNTNDMIFAYYWDTLQTRYPSFTGMSFSDIDDTKRLISEWATENFATANLTTLSDFISRLVDDYIENHVDRAADRTD